MSANVVGNYKIVEKIGEGGMGAVYKGVDLMLEREVAIKALRPELARQPHLVERFRAEAVTLAKLNHPNIATLHSFFRQGDDYYMVMEFVRGETLDKVLQRSGGMTGDWAVPLFCQALEGIDHAHRLGIVHRDIKPSNMMLTESGSIKVMDFGIARVLGTARMTKQGNIIGTIEYMSPEQVRGHETDSRSDIYSLGILLYEMLTGRVPFNSTSEYELMRSQIEDSPIPPREFAPHIPLYVEEAIMRALAKRPDARFQTAGEFRRVLMAGSTPVTAGLGRQTAEQLPSEVTREGRILAPGQLTPQTSFVKLGSLTQTGTADHMRSSSVAPAHADSQETPKSPEGPSVKETRLPNVAAPAVNPVIGAAVGQPVHAGPQQEVYVQPSPAQPSPGQEAPASSPSLLSRLTWKTYAVAGGVLFFLFVGAAVLIASVLLPGAKKPVRVDSATQNNSAVPTQPEQVQQLQAEPATSLTPGAALDSSGQGQPLTAQQPSPETRTRRSERAGSSGTDGSLGQGQGDGSGSEAVSPPATGAPQPAAPSSPGQPATAAHPRDAGAPRNPPPSSKDNKQATASETPEKKRGLFGKIKDKVTQPFKSQDKKQQ